MREFSIPVRVYIEDTDAGGIVFYANYLKFMERARTESLRHAGVNLDHLHRQHRRLFVVRSVMINYHIPARYDDQLTVSANIMTFRPASIEMEQPIHRGDELLTSSTVRLACVDADTLAPIAIPATISTAIREATNS